MAKSINFSGISYDFVNDTYDVGRVQELRNYGDSHRNSGDVFMNTQIYILIALVLVFFKFGFIDGIREYIYNKNEVPIEERKRIMLADNTYYSLNSKIGKKTARNIALIALNANLIACMFFLQRIIIRGLV